MINSRAHKRIHLFLTNVEKGLLPIEFKTIHRQYHYGQSVAIDETAKPAFRTKRIWYKEKIIGARNIAEVVATTANREVIQPADIPETQLCKLENRPIDPDNLTTDEEYRLKAKLKQRRGRYKRNSDKGLTGDWVTLNTFNILGGHALSRKKARMLLKVMNEETLDMDNLENNSKRGQVVINAIRALSLFIKNKQN